jgi:hypothetical protein
MGEAEVRSLLEEELDRVPFVRGVNNHMGSKVTADAGMMRAILQPIRERGLFFLDSRTTAKSVAYDVAVDMGIRGFPPGLPDADGTTASGSASSSSFGSPDGMAGLLYRHPSGPGR